MWAALNLFVVFLLTTYFIKKLQNKEPSAFNYYFHFFVFYFTTYSVYAVLLPFFLLRPTDVRNANIAARLIRNIVRMILRDIKWELRDGDILSEERGAVIVSNHQLTLDILGMYTIWDEVGKIAAIAKKQLLYVFPFGQSAYLSGVVFIDRSNPKAAYKQLKHTSELMINNKTKIWVFAEGTRNKDRTKLLPFKKGAFTMAVAAQVPIIPVVFSPYYFVNAEKHTFDKGHIVIQALEPVPTLGLTADDVPELLAKVHERMNTAYMELSKEVMNELPANY